MIIELSILKGVRDEDPLWPKNRIRGSVPQTKLDFKVQYVQEVVTHFI